MMLYALFGAFLVLAALFPLIDGGER